jgi:hypothetical protein
VAVPTEEAAWKAAQEAKMASRFAEIASILAASTLIVVAILLIESIRAG